MFGTLVIARGVNCPTPPCVKVEFTSRVTIPQVWRFITVCQRPRVTLYSSLALPGQLRVARIDDAL